MTDRQTGRQQAEKENFPRLGTGGKEGTIIVGKEEEKRAEKNLKGKPAVCLSVCVGL